MPDSPLLTAHNLQVSYRAHPILDGVNFAVHAGEVHGLIGPNGAGKSTVLKTLAGLITPDRGKVQLSGTPLLDLSARHRAQGLAYLPQDTHVEAALGVREVVTLGRYAHQSRLDRFRAWPSQRDSEAVDAALTRVGVTHLVDRKIAALSGGQRQLVLIAKLLAQQSQVLLLDEPVSALDLGYQLEVLQLLKELAREGHGIAVVLHDLNLAARFCDRLTVVQHGRVRRAGLPEEVIEPQLINELYGITSAVDIDPTTGAPRVTALTRCTTTHTHTTNPR